MIYGMNDSMNISDGLPFQYLFQFSHSNQTINIGCRRILRSQSYFLTLNQSSSMADTEEYSLQNQNVCLHLEIKHNWPIGDDIIPLYPKPKWRSIEPCLSTLQSSVDGPGDEVVGVILINTNLPFGRRHRATSSM